MQRTRRNNILLDNQKRRNGSAPVRALEEGYVSMKIPVEDFKRLCAAFPELQAEDPTVRLKAWKDLESGELGDLYRVTKRSPNQVRRAVRRGNQGIIIK